jgi:tetratricopeptide (TPR) repeat protein
MKPWPASSAQLDATEEMTNFAIALAVISLSTVRATAQVLPAAEARTQEEFDVYLEFHEAADHEAKRRAALGFERAYPESKLLVDVYQSEFEYARSREERQDAISAGEKALRLAPNDVKVLLGLAEVVPNGTKDPAALAQAEGYARRALVELKELRFPHEVSISECTNLQDSLMARTHATLGYVFGKRGDTAEAIRELEAAVAMSPEPAGPELFRLGKLYRASKREHDAVEMFRRAAKAGPTEITLLAESELEGKR